MLKSALSPPRHGISRRARFRRILLSSAVLGVGVCGASLCALVINQEPTRVTREELLDFRAKLALGQSREEVLADFDAGRYRNLAIQAGQNHWVVGSDRPLGIVNWLLWIQFANNEVVSLRFTTDDSLTKPSLAPDDAEVAGAAEWPVTANKSMLQSRIRGRTLKEPQRSGINGE